MRFLFFLSIFFLVSAASAIGAMTNGGHEFDIVIQNGHADAVVALAFSPDGKYLVSGSRDNFIKIWNRNGDLIRTFPPNKWMITCLAVSPDSAQIASGTRDGLIKLWDFQGNLQKTLTNHRMSVNAIAYSLDGGAIASASFDGKVMLWDKNGNLKKCLSGPTNQIKSLIYSPDGSSIICATASEGLFQWTASGEPMKCEILSNQELKNFIISPDGSNSAVLYKDGTLEIRNRGGAILKTLYSSGMNEITSISFSPDSRAFAIGFLSGIAGLIQFNGEVISDLSGHTDEVTSFAFSPDGALIATGSWDKSIRFCDRDGNLQKNIHAYSAGLNALVCSPDGKWILAGDDNGRIFRYSTLDFRLMDAYPALSNNVVDLALSPDARFLAAGFWSMDSDKTLTIMDLKGNRVDTLTGTFDFLDNNCLAFSPDGSTLACAYESNSILLHDRKSGKTATLYGHHDEVHSLAYTPDGKFLISGSDDGKVRVWNLKSKSSRVLPDSNRSSIKAVCVSPDGKRIAGVTKSRLLEVWTLEGKRLAEVAAHAGDINTVAFSPDGKWIATGSDDKTIKIWNPDGKWIKTLEGHRWTVTAIAFSPDGKFLYSSSSDTTIRCWNLENGNSVSLTQVDKGFLMFTDDGYFDGSRDAGIALAAVNDPDAVGVDQFAVRNNRPDLMLSRMGTVSGDTINGYHSQFLKRLKKTGLTNDSGLADEHPLSADFHVPQIKILDKYQFFPSLVKLEFQVSDDLFDIRSYQIYVNDIGLYGSGGVRIAERGVRLTNISTFVELSYGQNKVEFSCMNSAGTESYRARAFFNNGSPPSRRDLYYLGFGVSRYSNSALNLKYADKDAADLALYFASLKSGFSNIHILLFTNELATVSNIASAKSLLSNSGVDDTFVLFIAGHGVHDQDPESTYYFITHESDIRDLPHTAANFDLIEDLLHGIAPRNKLFLMDTCESGESDEEVESGYFAQAGSRGLAARTSRKISVIRKERKGEAARPYSLDRDRYIYNDLARRSGAIVFSSSKGGEFSYETDAAQNGLFTREILNCLESPAADKDGDGSISVDELREYVSQAVPKDTAGLQHPTVDRDNIYQKFGFPAPK